MADRTLMTNEKRDLEDLAIDDARHRLSALPRVQVFQCNLMDFEERWIASVCLQQQEEHELAMDKQVEIDQGRDWINGDFPPGMEWPWYAPKPWEVVEPEIFAL